MGPARRFPATSTGAVEQRLRRYALYLAEDLTEGADTLGFDVQTGPVLGEEGIGHQLAVIAVEDQSVGLAGSHAAVLKEEEAAGSIVVPVEMSLRSGRERGRLARSTDSPTMLGSLPVVVAVVGASFGLVDPAGMVHAWGHLHLHAAGDIVD